MNQPKSSLHSLYLKHRAAGVPHAAASQQAAVDFTIQNMSSPPEPDIEVEGDEVTMSIPPMQDMRDLLDILKAEAEDADMPSV